jgi:hypothetical protein
MSTGCTRVMSGSLSRRPRTTRILQLVFATAVGSLLIAGCGSSSSAGPKPTSTTPVGRTASGDIPDTAVYLMYKGTGYHIDYVEGWTLNLGQKSGITINDKDSNEIVKIVKTGSTQLFASADMSQLSRTTQKYHLVSMKMLPLGTGTAVHVQYRTLSAQDPVTGKQVPVVVERYYIPGHGKTAIVTLSTPVGVDNVDAFRRIAHSFRWA